MQIRLEVDFFFVIIMFAGTVLGSAGQKTMINVQIQIQDKTSIMSVLTNLESTDEAFFFCLWVEFAYDFYRIMKSKRLANLMKTDPREELDV